MYSKIISVCLKCVPAWLINLYLEHKLPQRELRRIFEIEHCLWCAEDIAQTTQHAHAQEIVEFLRLNSFAVRPISNGFKIIQARPCMRLPMTVLLPEDENVGGIWQSQYDMSDGNIANFVRDASGTFAILCLKGQVEISDFLKGLLCLHEGKHAWHFFSNPYNTKIGKLKEELQILEFECELIERHLGTEYTAFIKAGVERIAQLSKRGRNPVLQSWFVSIFREFSEKFKQSSNQTEEAIWKTILEYAIMFRFLTKYGPGDAESRKLHFIEHMENKSSRT